MARWSLYEIKEKPIKLKVPVSLCPQGHKHVPVKGECLVCKYEKRTFTKVGN